MIVDAIKAASNELHRVELRSEWPPVAGIHRGGRSIGSDMYPSECNWKIL